VWLGFNMDSAKRKNYFSWGKRIFRFTSALVPPAERGLGNECGRVSVLKKILRIFIKKYEK